MPRFTVFVRLVHKYLSLFVGLQILMWVVSGLFFTLWPIETNRSEDRMIKPPSMVIKYNQIKTLNQYIRAHKLSVEKLESVNWPDRVQLLVSLSHGPGAHDNPPIVIDGISGQILNSISREQAIRLVQAQITQSAHVDTVTQIRQASREYRGPFPVWRIQLDEPQHLAVYVDAHDGRIRARRSDMWRLYDDLWAWHIMDWNEHENFHHPLLMVMAFISLITVLGGLWLLPFTLPFRQVGVRLLKWIRV